MLQPLLLLMMTLLQYGYVATCPTFSHYSAVERLLSKLNKTAG